MTGHATDIAVDAVARHAIAIWSNTVAERVTDIIVDDFPDIASHGPALRERMRVLLAAHDLGEPDAIAAVIHLTAHPTQES